MQMRGCVYRAQEKQRMIVAREDAFPTQVTHIEFKGQCGAAATRAPSHSLDTDCALNSTSHLPLPWRHRCLSSSFWPSHLLH